MSNLLKSFVVAGQGCIFWPEKVLRIPLVQEHDATFVPGEQVEATTTLTNTESPFCPQVSLVAFLCLGSILLVEDR
jgi:hypothetical protein